METAKINVQQDKHGMVTPVNVLQVMPDLEEFVKNVLKDQLLILKRLPVFALQIKFFRQANSNA